MDLSDSIQQKFGAAAAAYAVSEVHRSGPDLDAMLEAAELAGGERVLDLGCGPGHTALAFASRGCRVTALDLTEEMLGVARALARARGLSGLRFERGDVRALAFADACFDVVTSRLSAHHYADPATALREVARVLAPGGRFLLVDTVAPEDPAQDSFMNAFELLRDPSHVRNHRVSEWLALLEAAGLRAASLRSFEISLQFEPWVKRIGTSPGAITGLHALFDAAPDEVRVAFAIDAEHGFKLGSALIRGRRPDATPASSAP